jgi:hypothetical protein
MHARLVRATSNHAQLLPSHDGLLGLTDHSASANIGRPSGDVQPGLQYQEHGGSMHDSHDADRPT